MLCYAIQYNRDADTWRELLREELNDLNNVMVVFLPPMRVILERLNLVLQLLEQHLLPRGTRIVMPADELIGKRVALKVSAS